MTASKLAALAGAAGAAAAALLLKRQGDATAAATAAAVAGGGKFDARLTGYWPYSASTEAERRMEGGTKDRKGRPLHTLEQHLADRVAHPYASVAGDDAIFPYGQRLSIDAFPGAVFRVVDTGGNFRGAKKVYRSLGREPLDVCVDSRRTYVPATATATIARGDHLDKAGRQVAAGGFKGQDVQLGSLELLGAESAS